MTTKTIRLTAAWLDRNAAPVAVVITLATFLVAGAIAAIGRQLTLTSVATSTTQLPVILIATSSALPSMGRAPAANIRALEPLQPPQPIIVPTVAQVEQPAAAPAETAPTPMPMATATQTTADAWSNGSAPDSEPAPARTVVPEPASEPNAKSFLQDAPKPAAPSAGALGNG